MQRPTTSPPARQALCGFRSDHLPQALSLCQTLNWPCRLEDWQSALHLGEGLAVECGGHVRATALWWPWGDEFATCGMIIVDAGSQRLGLGTRLMVDMTRDRLPRAGERDGIFYSMGYSGHGTQMLTYMGAIMAEVLDGKSGLNPWCGFTWPAIPGYFGRP